MAMTGKRALLVFFVTLAAAPAPAAAQPGGPVPAGAASCSGCHAPQAVASPVPSLNGRPADGIVTAMQEFRSGKRAATVMDRIAKGFADEEVRTIAAWLAAQR